MGPWIPVRVRAEPPAVLVVPHTNSSQSRQPGKTGAPGEPPGVIWDSGVWRPSGQEFGKRRFDSGLFRQFFTRFPKRYLFAAVAAAGQGIAGFCQSLLYGAVA